ncbi:FecR family protein [Maribacter sp. X9]|uniref:FecR family protein n=1 Tax=Maribacter sp. X9 TaxID=3402159 RepID=UPI003AF3F7A6
MKQKIRLIVKFLGREANLFELERLGILIEKRKGKKAFKQLVKIHYILSLTMKKYDVEKAKEVFKQRVRKDANKRNLSFFVKAGLAASILFLFSISLFDFIGKGQTSEINKVKHNIETGTDRAILTLENGNQMVLEKGQEYESEIAKGDGKSLSYQQVSKENNFPYNYLTIPRGGQFKLKLSDGTLIWLNSDTKLKYPVNFKKNGPREIELLYGEVFLKVSPSSEHNGSSFNLISRGQIVQVLGTEFNVRSYADEALIKTTLLEGSVSIDAQGVSTLLEPNQQSIYNDKLEEIEVKKVDASQEIAWVNGLFAFDTQSLSDIMKTLARWYNVEVVFESASLKEFVFTGILERSSSIDDVLSHIEASSEEKLKFIIDDRTILIQAYVK